MAAGNFSFYDDAGEQKDLSTLFGNVDTALADTADTDYSDLRDTIKRQLAEQYYQQGPDLKTFETMLNKLTGSKMKQQGQVASARRGDIYAGGLANMMSNF